jgi:glucan phosphoethanolaminetransferase (alkaline phosphatase superfamily)
MQRFSQSNSAAPPRRLVFPKPGRLFWLALLFTALLTAYEAWVFAIDYYDFYVTTTTRGIVVWNGRPIGALLFMMAGSFLSALAFFWVAFRSPGPLRALAFALFALAVLYEYSYRGTLGRFSTPEDLLMALLYRDPALFLDAIRIYLNPRALLAIAIFGGLLLIRPRSPLRPQALLLVIGCAVVLYSAIYSAWSKASLPFPMSSYPTVSVSAFLRSATYAPWKAFHSYNGPRDAVPPIAATPPANNVVFVVDESIRGDRLSVNGYERATTPYLDSLASQGMVASWGVASSGGTCSLQSNKLLLTGLNVLPDREQAIDRWPSIFQYAKAMGYRTSYLDSSSDSFWNGTRYDLGYIDEWQNVDAFLADQAYDADRNLGARLYEILSTSSGNFIWVNKRGVHFQYTNAYPADAAVWEPVLELHTHDPRWSAEIGNSYDNGVRYNLEGFFRAMLPDTAILSNTMIVYTSDHGQTLAEHGEYWSHCRDSYNEANVPLLLIGAPGLQVDTGFAASHFHLFATLLDLLGVPDDRRLRDYEPSLLRLDAADSRPRRYFPGGLDGTNGGGYMPFDGAEP